MIPMIFYTDLSALAGFAHDHDATVYYDSTFPDAGETHGCIRAVCLYEGACHYWQVNLDVSRHSAIERRLDAIGAYLEDCRVDAYRALADVGRPLNYFQQIMPEWIRVGR